MCASPLTLFREGPPPPKVVLLPDALFFTRAVPVTVEGADEREHRQQVATQVELALEAMAPFPLNQLYYGHFWAEGSPHALAYAAYRRRFTIEQTSEWEGAALVLPTFAALLHATAAPATTLIVSAPDGFTAIHWGQGAVPTRIVHRAVAPLPADESKDEAAQESAAEAARAAEREALLRQFESKQVVDATDPVAVLAGDSDGAFVATAGAIASHLSAADAESADVRDKNELALLRRARKRDVLLWRAAVACIAAFGLFILGEIGLVAGGLWQKARSVQIQAQAPAVERISDLNQVAMRINDLRTKRLLPIEMIRLVGEAPVKPPTTYFVQANATKQNLYSIQLRGETANTADIAVYRNNIEQLPQVAPDGVDLRIEQTRESLATFSASVTFKPGAVKLAPPPPSVASANP